MAKGKRYSRILSAAKYYSSIDNYIKYITDSTKRGQNVGSGRDRPKSKKLWIDPFNVALAENQVVPCSCAENSFTTYTSAVASRTKSTAPSDEDLIIKLDDFAAARVSITTGRSTSGTAKTSKVTGMKYLDYGGKSTSVPFGRKNASDTQTAAFNEIKAAILAITAGAIVTLVPEKF